MVFNETDVRGAYLIEIEEIGDDRGFFARTWCRNEFEAHGLVSTVAQCSIGFNVKRGTLRGMHFSVTPHAEVKLIRCSRGAIYDVIVDLRRESPSYRRWVGVQLTEDNRRTLYVPAGCAHGYQTLTDHAEVSYQMDEFYSPECARGARFDDPAFGIEWPLEVSIISERDRNWPDYPR
jgi:dTDP-4-dehydrorhamnose 3,5-epimerase